MCKQDAGHKHRETRDGGHLATALQTLICGPCEANVSVELDRSHLSS
jgi:hypothetical protein